ncbi:hypothetical protein HYH03_001074 [Edaphochlamys debaryana]|uniref:FAS1 domain-containing protein n=1 Tax=Edaphochlamys debaryana TaxID=47281 RepID=A0A836C6L6_9CHLO|nr:hypothetical protein HYH03_001074 [Edaphochlamys debaryana]|eukprot:KAG2501268.1 hypothetical protein HYH03_001074 [Edaphochlamys debaryana]
MAASVMTPPGMSWGSAAASAAGLDADLLSKVSTVFVPSDDAIKAYVASSGLTTADLATGSGKAAVTAHVIPNTTLTSADFPAGASSYDTVAGSKLSVDNSGGKLTVSSGGVTANVIQADISTGNATIFLIDKVLAPAV